MAARSTKSSSRAEPMAIERQAFLRTYVGAMREGHAALFVGAGLSRPAGFVDWRGLLQECASDLKLDLETVFKIIDCVSARPR